jgi:aspartate/methionine/tyrosine aminotransferase
MAILADEVYQENIYKEGAQFVSVRKVLSEMEPKIAHSVEVVSFNSASKGLAGECGKISLNFFKTKNMESVGLRSGYAQFENLPKEATETIGNLNNYRTVTNTLGQVCLDLILHPPSIDDGLSAETVEAHQAELDEIKSTLARKARLVADSLNSMKHVKCQEIEGAMYAFPKLELSEKAIKAAKEKGVAPDHFYCEKGTLFSISSNCLFSSF